MFIGVRPVYSCGWGLSPNFFANRFLDDACDQLRVLRLLVEDPFVAITAALSS
jgi:hypothetical protein